MQACALPSEAELVSRFRDLTLEAQVGASSPCSRPRRCQLSWQTSSSPARIGSPNTHLRSQASAENTAAFGSVLNSATSCLTLSQSELHLPNKNRTCSLKVAIALLKVIRMKMMATLAASAALAAHKNSLKQTEAADAAKAPKTCPPRRALRGTPGETEAQHMAAHQNGFGDLERLQVRDSIIINIPEPRTRTNAASLVAKTDRLMTSSQCKTMAPSEAKLQTLQCGSKRRHHQLTWPPAHGEEYVQGHDSVGCLLNCCPVSRLETHVTSRLQG